MVPYPFEPLDYTPKIEPLSADPATILTYIDGKEPPKLLTECMGEFSVDEDRKIKFDVSNRQFLNKDILKKCLVINLTEGIEQFVYQEDEEYCDINHSLQWLTHQYPVGSSLKEAVSESDIVVHS